MTSDGSELFSFPCPKCDKKLKAPVKASGKNVRCPKCNALFAVPRATVPPIAPASNAKPPEPVPVEDPFSLKTPAIMDRKNREHEAASVRASKEKQRHESRIGSLRRRHDRDLETEAPIPFDSLDHPIGGPGSSEPSPEEHSEERLHGDKEISQPAAETPKRSVFDDDLPELEQLQEITSARVSENNVKHPRKSVAAPPVKTEQPDNLEDLLPDLEPSATLPPLIDDQPDEISEYRVICKTCGTAQWIPLSVKGKKIKCPDCFSEFRAPPPPTGQSTKKQKIRLDDSETPLHPATELPPAQTSAARRERTQQLLDKARKEISEEDIERLYDTDFDTAGFVHRTFGFLRDTINLAQIGIYGFIFAILFGLAQFGASNTEGFFGRGMLLVAMIMVPIVAILFAIPMLTGGLALIEAVANKQRVEEFPAFSMFENVGEVILITAAVSASVVPGFLVGQVFAGGEGSFLLQLSAMMITCFALFPLFLLSMLDNNSIFQPISGAVLRSVKDAAEAWGGYYLKTLIAFFVVMLVCIVFLGRSPAMAAIAGFMLPLFVFFVCQQVGALADAIGDHLSFEIGPHETRHDDSADDELT